MAKIILSALLDDIRGKIAGSVFQMTVGGLQMRTRVSPRNPRTGNQQQIRSNYSRIVLTWPYLDTADQATWLAASIGDDTGFNLYFTSNMKIKQATGQDLNVYSGTGALPINAVTFDTLTDVIFAMNPATAAAVLPADTYLVVSATKQLKSGTSFISPSSYTLLNVFTPGFASGSDIDLFTIYTTIYGSLIEGSTIGVQWYTINEVTGDYSPTERGQAVVIIP
jgi:hypothetical protein